MSAAPEAKAKPGPRWKKGAAIAAACTQWSTTFVQVDLLLKKSITECTVMQADHAKLSEERRKLIEKDKEFSMEFTSLFQAWSGQSLAIENEKDSTFDKVMAATKESNQIYYAIQQKWIETAPESAELKSWRFMETFSTSTLAQCESKDALTAKIEYGKQLRKITLDFVKSYEKTIANVMKHVAKMSKEELQDKHSHQARQATVQETEVLVTAADASVPTVTAAPSSSSARSVLAIFSAGDALIPQMCSFSVDSVSHFTRGWMKGMLSISEIADKIKDGIPYLLEAKCFLDEAMQQSCFATGFGRFMADFLGSSEYHSTLGRGTSSLNGCGSTAERLRQMIVMHGEPIILSKKLLETCLRSTQQQGSHSAHLLMHTCAYLCVCVCVSVHVRPCVSAMR